ncbi:MAG: DnaJ domain-containing protein [Magnetococcales bacterium]|nr:DnaJ domain-containing protein [Magnetococcales bacterium]
MGIAVASHRVTPPRSQPPSPPEAHTEERPPKKCHYLPTRCRACGVAMTVTYPLAVTFWKFACAACNKPYSIEVVGHHKCLVYEQLGRRTVERIGLTQERRTFYRARCYACNTVVITAAQEMGLVQSCQHCKLDFIIRADHDMLFYETVIQHQEHPVIFRDKVQILEGHILQTGNLFFLDEDIGSRTQQGWIDAISQLEGELAALRNQENAAHASLLRLQAEKNDLLQQIKQQKEKEAQLASRLRALEERAHTSSQHELQKVQKENKALLDKINTYNDLLRDLDRQNERASQWENMYQGAVAKINKLTTDNHQLASRLTGQEAVLQDLQRRTEKIALLEAANRDLNKKLKTLQDNPPAAPDTGKAAAEIATLETRLRALQQANKLLAGKAQEQGRLEARVVALETELNLLRHRGQERPEPKEEWYCEEGEEASIPPQGQAYQERRILGIRGEATPERIKTALRRRIRKYHPDMVASMGIELRELAHRKTQEITRAYSHLMNTCARG